MRVPLSWLLEYAHLDLPAGPDGASGRRPPVRWPPG